MRIVTLITLVSIAACTGAIDAPPGDSADAGAGNLADADPNAPDADPNAPDAGTQNADAAPALGPPRNPFGIGLVGPGNTAQWDRAAELAGFGGYIKPIFAGVELSTSAPNTDWVDAVTQIYARDLIPVIRLGPPWGDRNIRDKSDDAEHMSYTGLANAYAAVVAGLPRREDWPLVIEVHNEPDLCYEWVCAAGTAPSHPDAPDGWMHYSDIAAEYAAFLRDVTDAIHAIGDPRIVVINGGLAPGGARTCECGGEGFTAGITSRDYMVAMESAVPGVFDALDGFSSHPYPAEGEGWGFFVAYDAAGPGLSYWQTELAILDIDLPVYITETGWTVSAGAHGSREQIASWTVSAYANDWFDEPRIAGVMPFILQDGSWNDFAWVDGAGNPYPVFTAVRDWRCAREFPAPCD
jgi:hypothetical protein